MFTICLPSQFLYLKLFKPQRYLSNIYHILTHPDSLALPLSTQYQFPISVQNSDLLLIITFWQFYSIKHPRYILLRICLLIFGSLCKHIFKAYKACLPSATLPVLSCTIPPWTQINLIHIPQLLVISSKDSKLLTETKIAPESRSWEYKNPDIYIIYY